ncbi:transketolase [Nakamurella leprariae]|uniref:Transketolase n=1 Tax=Nakamurella leprariae TaxID=2803911 RepID=A0A938Y5T0_9ACTN|nr:transketolase [Nakamurella leprariae]MBM9466561.1 transketolase [Nakamurella leprariae]
MTITDVGDRTAVTGHELRDRAFRLRQRMMAMAADKGEGYIAQGLGIADLLAVAYFRQLRFDPAWPDWPERDRFVLSTGHYSIAMYAVLAELGVLSEEDIATYGLNGSDLPMSTFDETPGVEITGGSLGHGLGQGVGMALGLRLDGSPARVMVELSDGELQEGSTWEAAMSAGSFALANLTAVVDCNGIQADGPMVLAMEPVADKWRAFGWAVEEVDGNDIDQLCRAFDALDAHPDRPKVLIARTTPGCGIPTLMARERAHFVRVAEGEWASLIEELEAARG